MTPDALAELFWRWVLPAAAQATPLLLLAAGFDLLLPRLLAPKWRAAIWTAAGLKLVLPFAWFAPWGLLPRWEMAGSTPSHPLPRWAWMVPVVWLGGSIVLGAGSGLWLRRETKRWKRDATAAHNDRLEALARTFGVDAPRLYESPAVYGPVVIGWLRPSLLWPAAIRMYLNEAEQDQALRHELAHVRRRDGWRDLAWSVLLLVFWFHPLVWWAVRRMRAIREQCCDATAARLPGHCPESYRSALLKVMARMEGMTAAPGLALIDPRAPLSDRLALLRAERGGHRRKLAGLLALAAVLLAWPSLSWADRSSAAVAEWIVRPPGSLQLRYLVLERLAEENSK